MHVCTYLYNILPTLKEVRLQQTDIEWASDAESEIKLLQHVIHGDCYLDLRIPPPKKHVCIYIIYIYICTCINI